VLIVPSNEAVDLLSLIAPVFDSVNAEEVDSFILVVVKAMVESEFKVIFLSEVDKIFKFFSEN
jgi:hypothetical protein